MKKLKTKEIEIEIKFVRGNKKCLKKISALERKTSK